MNWFLNFSLRYFVVGVYRDRDRRVYHIYPWPFTRITLDWTT